MLAAESAEKENRVNSMETGELPEELRKEEEEEASSDDGKRGAPSSDEDENKASTRGDEASDKILNEASECEDEAEPVAEEDEEDDDMIFVSEKAFEAVKAKLAKGQAPSEAELVRLASFEGLPEDEDLIPM